MKRMLAILLCAVLLLSALPILSAGAKEASIEQKFKLLLDDIEIAYPHHYANQYYFDELKKGDGWTLIRGGMSDTNPLDKTPDLRYATVGNKLVWSNANSEPFKSGYGVYDLKFGVFYDLTDAWGRDFSGLRDAWNALPGDEGVPAECGAQIIGDADRDNEVTILDATRIQRYIAELDDNPFEETLKKDYYFGYPLYNCTDFDRDGDFTIVDATKLQRRIADLSNMLDYKVAWDYATPSFYDVKKREKFLVTDRSQLQEDHKDEKEMLDKYDDSFFKDHCLIGLNTPDMEQYSMEIKSVSIDPNGVLTVEYVAERLEAIPAAPCHRCTCIELTKAFVDVIKDIKVNITEKEPEQPTASDYQLAWDERYFPGYNSDKQDQNRWLIDSLDELDLSDSRFATAENLDAEKKIRDAYGDDFFKNNSLLLLDISLGSGTYVLTLDNLSVDKDGVLTVDFTTNHPQVASGDINDRFIAIELKKAIADRVKDIKVNINGSAVPAYLYRPAKHPYLRVDTGSSEAKLFTSRSQLDPSSVGHQQLLDDYDESFFKNNAILAVSYYLPSGSILDQFTGIGFFETVDVYMKEYRPFMGTFDEKYVSYCFEVSKDALSKTDGKVRVLRDEINNQPYGDDSMIYNNDVDIDKPVALSTRCEEIYFDDLYHTSLNTTSWGAKDIYSELLNEARSEKQSPISPFDPAGIAGIITNPIDMENMIHDSKLSNGYVGNGQWWYELDKDYQYDLRFFDQYALVAISQIGLYNETLSIKGLYKKDGVLYIDAQLGSATGASPEEVDYLTFVRVNKSVIADVTSVKVGKPTSDEINFNVMEAYDPDYAFTDETGAVHITKKSHVDIAISELYGEIDRDNHTFEIEKKDDKYFETHDVIAMRVYQGSSAVTLEVTGVERETTQLNVSIDRHHPNLIQPPDSHIQLVFLEIPKLDAWYDIVKVNFNDILDNNGLIAELTPENKRYDESYIISRAFDYKYITAREKEAVKGDKIVNYSMNDLYLDEENGSDYILLMRNKAEFDQHFGGIKTSYTYSDSYFNTSALIAVVGVGNCGDAVAKINSLAVTDEGRMLYSDAQIDYPHPDLGATDNTPLVWTFYEVNRSDVKNVSGIGFWNADSMIREITSRRETMNNLLNDSGNSYRPLASTVLDIEPKSSQARYDLSYSSLGLNESNLTGGYIMMIKDTRTLNRYFPSKHFKTEAYTDAYFKDNAIIAMVSHGDEDTARADLKAPAVVGEQLYIDAGVSYHPYFSTDGMEAEMPSSPLVWAFRQVKKSDISGVKSFCFWNSEATVEPIYFRYDIPDPTSENVTDIKTTEITMSAPSESDFSWKPLGSSETGYTLILNSRAALEYYLPGFDTEKKYNDAFFKDSAIIASVLKGNDYTSTAHFGKIGLINNTLFVNAYYTNDLPVDNNGNPIARPSAPTIWTFRKVSKADIKSIGDIQFWNAK